MEEESEREIESERDSEDRVREVERGSGGYRPAQRLPAASLSRPLSPQGICALLAGVLILKAVITLPVLWHVSPPHS